jgi:hypothetical protein
MKTLLRGHAPSFSSSLKERIGCEEKCPHSLPGYTSRLHPSINLSCIGSFQKISEDKEFGLHDDPYSWERKCHRLHVQTRLAR